MVNFNTISIGSNLQLKGMIFLMIIAVTCEAAPTKPRQVNPSHIHKLSGKFDSEKSLKEAMVGAGWFTRKSTRDKRCPYTFKISDPHYNRLPRHIVEADCKSCNLLVCKPLTYHLFVRKTDGKGKREWRLKKITVAYIYNPY